MKCRIDFHENGNNSIKIIRDQNVKFPFSSKNVGKLSNQIS
jgi:hypothetical protein